jgi:predicted RNA binding protein YcfA (HicA-like mRNA interferase family)
MLPPTVTSLECVRALLKLGFSIRRQHGTSVALERPGRIVVVPLGKMLGEDALALILLSARVAAEDFERALARSASGEHAIDASALIEQTRAARPHRA